MGNTVEMRAIFGKALEEMMAKFANVEPCGEFIR